MKKMFFQFLCRTLPKGLVIRLRKIIGAIWWMQQGSKEVEDFDYYSVSTAFMLQCVKESGRELSKLPVLSVGCKVGYLVSILPLLGKVLHNSMVEMQEEIEIKEVGLGDRFTQTIKDFFTIDKNELVAFPEGFGLVLSHATIHCMSDLRYENNETGIDFWGGRERPYMFAKKLKALNDRVDCAVIISCAVSTEENIANDGGWLSHEKLVNSFESAGFELKKVLFDTNCFEKMGSKERKPRLFESLPIESLKSQSYVVGNYYFEAA